MDVGCYSTALELSFYGINGSLLSWIKDFLLDCSQSVILEGKTSRSHSVLSGVPQGTVSAPLLFLLYILTYIKSIPSDFMWTIS